MVNRNITKEFFFNFDKICSLNKQIDTNNHRKMSSTPNPFNEKLKTWQNIIQDCNVNFLIGSGLSNPFFGTLGNIEIWLTELENDNSLKADLRDYIKASLYASYFVVAMQKNIILYDEVSIKDELISAPKNDIEKLQNTYKGYKDFLRLINQIVYQRRSNTVNKQTNLFTTNIDIFLEKVIEDLNLHFNDGFNGVFKKTFSLSNFKKSFYQKSLHYDNIAEIPVYNLLKIHGSITWKLEGNQLMFNNIDTIYSIEKEYNKIKFLDIIKLDNDYWNKHKKNIPFKEIVKEAQKTTIIDTKDFVSAYEKLQVVNPTKAKFKDTTFNKSYYEMLRLYANELEKENSVLFIFGFSMADEHIRDITFRAIRSNPTLKVFISSYTKAATDIVNNLKLDNIDLKDFHNVELLNEIDNFNLNVINETIFKKMLDNINCL
ncbi:SIR2 family protein [Chryseobacterium sp. Y16C]|uniref:SIR2 family protein n=1 Tax=Chryseobacterium sp. Y16C TaxID=2920939 RepID=UPI001F0B05C9|nr:SIR2 family protein [Chryseobacterium sp. Y16C]UMQ43214.1 SIR2 family protein [Chryseobacterium sp. Y16C]